MNNEALIAMFGFLSLMGGLVRWLMQVNYKQSLQIQTQKRENTQKSIDELREILDDLKKEIKIMQVEMRETNSGFKSSQNALSKIGNSLAVYIESNNSRFDKITTEVLDLSKEVKMYRTKKNETKRD